MSTNDRVSCSNLSKQSDMVHSACAGVDTVFRVDRGEFKSLNTLVISKYLWISGPNAAGVKLLEMEFLGGFMPRWVLIDILNRRNFFYGVVFDLYSNRCRNLEFLSSSVAFNLMIRAVQFERYSWF